MTRIGFRTAIQATTRAHLVLAWLILALAACGPAARATADLTPILTPSATPTGAAPSGPLESSAPSGPSPSAEPGATGSFGCDLPIHGLGSTARAQITDVRVGEHAGYDRITVEFASGVPEFSIEEARPPFTQDASGLPIAVDGSAVWKIVLRGGTRVSPDGGVTYDGPAEFRPGFTKLVHLVEGGDFEAVSSWYVGMSASSCLRVAMLDAPSRLVIDIEH